MCYIDEKNFYRSFLEVYTNFNKMKQKKSNTEKLVTIHYTTLEEQFINSLTYRKSM